MAYLVTFPTQHLVLAGVPLSTPAWELLNIHVLLAGYATRGSNVVIPEASGTKPRRRRPTERTVTLAMHVFGDADAEGTPYADSVDGLLANITALRALTDPPATNNSVVTASLIWKSRTIDAPVQVVSLEIGESAGPTSVAATIDLLIPSGAFT
jgi:hypothetical protein